LWLIPGGFAGLVLHPRINLAVVALSLLPSAVVVVWGTIKFRSYYEAKRTRAHYLTMAYATLIQLLALAFLTFQFVQLLAAIDLFGVLK